MRGSIDTGRKSSRWPLTSLDCLRVYAGWQTHRAEELVVTEGAWMDLEQDLRTVSDEMLRALEQLQRLETAKRSAAPGTPRFLKLAREVEKLAAMVFAQTSVQQSLAEQTHSATRAGADIAPIEEIAVARDLSVILAEWRDAERRLAATDMETAEHAKAAGDVRRLRDEYHRAYRAQSIDRS